MTDNAQKRKILKKPVKKISLVEEFSRIFEENLTSFEYFFFSVTLALLGKDLTEVISGFVLGLALFLFSGGVIKSSAVRYIKMGIEYKMKSFLLGGIFLLVFICSCFLVIILSFYRL